MIFCIYLSFQSLHFGSAGYYAPWLSIIFLAPIFGWIVFLTLGTNKLPKSRRDIQKTLDHSIEATLKSLRRQHEGVNAIIDAPVPIKYASISKLAKALAHLPVFSRNTVRIINTYDTLFTELVSDIDAAGESVYLEFFIITFDNTTEPVFDALARAAHRGLDVRVLYDYVGSHKYPGYRKMKRRFKEDGIVAHSMLPIRLPTRGYVRPDLRNHRKLAIFDHTIGYTGSQNLIARGYHRKDDLIYDELMVRIEGPLATQLFAVFSTDWFSETGEAIAHGAKEINPSLLDEPEGDLLQLVPSGPGYEDENNLKLFAQAIYTAQSSIMMVNPYFVPTDELMTALISAARRGVTIRLVNSAAIDQWFVAHAQRSYYEALLKAGVEIYLYNKPILLHAKYIVIDGEATMVGSSNFDIRSFELDHELTLVSYTSSFAGKMNALAQEYIARSRPLDAKRWFTRGFIRKALDSLARLSSSLQ
jgi:cardiolipin synthase